MAWTIPAPEQTDWKYLRPQELRQFKNLLLAARTIVEGAYSGRHKSPYKGSSQEFTDYREYSPGDDIRSIDWRAYARTDRYFIKLFEKETDLNCYLLVDSSASMGFGGRNYKQFFKDDDLSKFEYACYLAAALAYLTVKQGDRVGLTLFDRKVKAHTPPGGAMPHLYRILNLLEAQKVGFTTSISRVLRESFPMFKRRGLLILISDMLDDPDDIFEALSMYCHRQFEVVLLQVLHKHEITLPSLPSVNFIDAETTERITSVPGDIRESYEQQIREFTDGLAARAVARGIDHQLMSTETPFHVALERYLRGRGD